MTTNKKKILTELKKTQGSILKMNNMTERNRDSIDIMEKNIAVFRFLRVIHKNLMEDYFKLCFNKGVEVKSRKKREKMIGEILKAMYLVNK